MNAHPRLRKAAKWGGLGLAGVCVAAWCVSARWTVDYGALDGRGVMLGFGAVSLTFNEDSSEPTAAALASPDKLYFLSGLSSEPAPAPGARTRSLLLLRRDLTEPPWLGGGMQWTYDRYVTSRCGWEGSSNWETAVLPLWMPAALGLAVGVPAWILDRRARRRVLAGHCSKCGYDRSTLPLNTPCPECGAGGR